jgi:hypothetical protein
MSYELEDCGSIPSKGTIFAFSISFKLAVGPTQPPIQWVSRNTSRVGGEAAGA